MRCNDANCDLKSKCHRFDASAKTKYISEDKACFWGDSQESIFNQLKSIVNGGDLKVQYGRAGRRKGSPKGGEQS